MLAIISKVNDDKFDWSASLHRYLSKVHSPAVATAHAEQIAATLAWTNALLIAASDQVAAWALDAKTNAALLAAGSHEQIDLLRSSTALSLDHFHEATFTRAQALQASLEGSRAELTGRAQALLAASEAHFQ